MREGKLTPVDLEHMFCCWFGGWVAAVRWGRGTRVCAATGRVTPDLMGDLDSLPHSSDSLTQVLLQVGSVNWHASSRA